MVVTLVRCEWPWCSSPGSWCWVPVWRRFGATSGPTWLLLHWGDRVLHVPTQREDRVHPLYDVNVIEISLPPLCTGEKAMRLCPFHTFNDFNSQSQDILLKDTENDEWFFFNYENAAITVLAFCILCFKRWILYMNYFMTDVTFICDWCLPLCRIYIAHTGLRVFYCTYRAEAPMKAEPYF